MSKHQPSQTEKNWMRALIIVPFLMVAFGCTSVGRMVVAPTPTLTATALPTLQPTSTLTPTSTITPTSTWTPPPPPTNTTTPPATATATNTFTPAPKPEAEVVADNPNVRRGPATSFGTLQKVSKGEIYDIVGTNDDGSWWQICCLEEGKSGWIRSDQVIIGGPLNEVAILNVPTPTPRPTATITPIPPTPTPGLAFYRGIGPVHMKTNNQWLTLWVKVYSGSSGDGFPVQGWRMEIKRDGQTVAITEPSGPTFGYSAPPGSEFGNRVVYNLKQEVQNPGTGNWEVFLIDPGGVRRSPIVTFTTGPNDPNREKYIGFLAAD